VIYTGCTGGNKNQYNILARTREVKGPLEKSRHRRKGKTKMHSEETGRNVLEWIHQAGWRDN
jgi:hypothetical protein